MNKNQDGCVFGLLRSKYIQALLRKGGGSLHIGNVFVSLGFKYTTRTQQDQNKEVENGWLHEH